MKYTKQSTTGGAWVKNSEVVSGTKCKLVSETLPQEGEFGKRDVAKIRFEGVEESKNCNINKPTINALIDAFGEDSKEWIGKILVAHTEKMIVGGKRVTALYLIPEGFEMGEDAGGYILIKRIGAEQASPSDDFPQEEVNPEDSPF